MSDSSSPGTGIDSSTVTGTTSTTSTSKTSTSTNTTGSKTSSKHDHATGRSPTSESAPAMASSPSLPVHPTMAPAPAAALSTAPSTAPSTASAMTTSTAAAVAPSTASAVAPPTAAAAVATLTASAVAPSTGPAATPATPAERKFIHSAAFVRAHPSLYEAVDHAVAVELVLPSGATEEYLLARPTNKGTTGSYSPAADLVATVVAIVNMTDAPSNAFADATFRDLLDRARRRAGDLELAHELATAYNSRLRAARSAGAWAAAAAGPISSELTAHLWKQAYDRVVDDPASLNNYRSFSKEVYGETCHPLVSEVLERVGAKRKQLFVDFGMGIGNVIFQAAAQCHCNVVGIELKDTPFRYAEQLFAELEVRVAAYCRTMGRVRLFHGDFLQHVQLAALVNAIDIVFVNNYAFEAETNTGLVQLFISLKTGARVVSFKSFAPPKNRITEHNADDPAAIFQVAKHTYLRTDGVSWASMQMDYFVHTVDRTRLRTFQTDSNSKKRKLLDN